MSELLVRLRQILQAGDTVRDTLLELPPRSELHFGRCGLCLEVLVVGPSGERLRRLRSTAGSFPQQLQVHFASEQNQFGNLFRTSSPLQVAAPSGVFPLNDSTFVAAEVFSSTLPSLALAAFVFALAAFASCNVFALAAFAICNIFPAVAHLQGNLFGTGVVLLLPCLHDVLTLDVCEHMRGRVDVVHAPEVSTTVQQ